MPAQSDRSSPPRRAAPRARVRRDDFDAALVPGFREATRGDYRALAGAWQETAEGALGADGRFQDRALRHRDCPLCATARASAEPLFTKLGMDIVRCAGCGLTYSATMLAPEFDRRLYVDSASQASYIDLKENEAYAALERVKCRYLVERLGDYLAPATLLDVGPGSGRFLEAAADAGWQGLGVEANAQFAAACRARGLAIAEGFFPECPPGDARFDAIAMLDVVEHLGDPAGFLGDGLRRLNAGGVLVLQVPNVKSLLVALEGARNSNFCHGHWNHFDPATLERLAASAGLETLAMETIISELDRIEAFPRPQVDSAIRRIAGVEPPAVLDPGWLHAHGMGYKVLGFFRLARA
jgi:SAM-dependent methyltransferase